MVVKHSVLCNPKTCNVLPRTSQSNTKMVNTKDGCSGITWDDEECLVDSSRSKHSTFSYFGTYYQLLFEAFRATSTTKCATVAAATTAAITRRSIAKRVRKTPDNTGTVVNRMVSTRQSKFIRHFTF
jgi:hypothetical protein